jgi:D-xylose transport system substrate-binding protein
VNILDNNRLINNFKRGVNIMKKFLMLVVVMCVLGLSSAVFTAERPEEEGPIMIGMSFAEFYTERWSREMVLINELAAEAGVQAFYQVANNDIKLQNDQIENMVIQGADVIIIVATDGAAQATAVEKAAEAGVPCIAYDRLIKTEKVAAWITFDPLEVGRQLARGILEVRDSGRFVLLAGDPEDVNAVMFRQGQMEILQPLIDSGQIEVVADQWVPKWDPVNAVKIMENILAAQDNRIDAVASMNDGTALGSLQALGAQGLAGKIPIAGQDATAAGCKSIVEGELTFSVFKDIRVLAKESFEMALKLAKGEPTGLPEYNLADHDPALKGSVPVKYLPTTIVDKSNVYDVIIKAGFQPYDEVYADIPEHQRPPKP